MALPFTRPERNVLAHCGHMRFPFLETPELRKDRAWLNFASSSPERAAAWGGRWCVRFWASRRCGSSARSTGPRRRRRAKTRAFLPASARPGSRSPSDPLPLLAHADVLLDFTAPKATLAYSELAAQARIVHVIGTTGIDAEGDERLKAAARHCRIVKAGNMSLGVNVLAGLVRRAAAVLGPDYDIEIVEMHHRHKVDAPSGTALASRARGG